MKNKIITRTITREKLITSVEWWLGEFQLLLYNHILDYIVVNNLSDKEFMEKFKIGKGEFSKIMRGEFDGKISRYIEILNMIDLIPKLNITHKQNVISQDKAKNEKLKLIKDKERQ